MIHNNIRQTEHNNKYKQMQNRYGQHNKTVIKGDCTLHNHAQYATKVTIYTSKSCKYKNKLNKLNFKSVTIPY